MSAILGSFVELERRFSKLDPTGKSEEDILSSYSFDPFFRHVGSGWSELLTKKRVVILGEPGSGKTREFQERAALLSRQGEFAFFVRLDQLARQPLSTVLGGEEQRRFARWLKSEKIAFLFLDSVDEAKFHSVSDFYSALDKLRGGIGSAFLQRTRIFLSSRISEWRPLADPLEFRTRFPNPNSDPKNAEAESENPLIIQLDSLNTTQVKLFAQANGVFDVEAFVTALDAAFAWEFASRPLDVLELVSYWNDTRKIGSLKEIIRHDIRVKLQPRIGRDDHPIPEAQAQEGAEWLAAATVFSRTFTFWVPDEGFGGSGGLDFRACLPTDWNPASCRALHNRSLFDGANYGRIRFHHRRVAEYLAARWIKARMDAGCPTYELERLLVAKVGTRRVIRPTLRPIAAWLCDGNARWNQFVRGWVLEAAPEIHLAHGDPVSLSIEYRSQILHAIAELSKGRRRIWLETSHDSLARLADPGLSSDIASLILDRTLAIDFRIEMLEMVRHGRLIGCLEAATTVLACVDEPDELRPYAVAAIGALHDVEIRRRLVQIANDMPEIPSPLCRKIAEVLYPETINAEELAGMLAKSGPVDEFRTGLPSHLKEHFESVVDGQRAGSLLKSLLALVQKPPLASRGNKTLSVSERFAWVGEVILSVLTKLLGKAALSSSEADLAAEAAWLLGHVRELHKIHDKDLQGLNRLTASHKELRRTYFWRTVSRCREERGKEPTAATELFGYWEVLKLLPDDLDWLLREVKTRPDLRDQGLALRIAIEAWDAAGRRLAGRVSLRRAATHDPALRAIYQTSVIASIWFPIKMVWWRHVRHSFGQRWWWRHKFDSMRRFAAWLRVQWSLLRHLRGLTSGAHIGWLAELAFEAEEEHHQQLAPLQWIGLRKKRGRLITIAARRGCKAAWRRFIPPLPHENKSPGSIDNRLVAGLAGLQALFQDREIDFASLSEEDAKLVVRYAVNEMNGFPIWLPDLIAVRPNIVAKVLSECVEGEWTFPREQQQTHEVLARLAWQSETFAPLVRDTLVRLLQAGDPPNFSILQFALTILTKGVNPPRTTLADLAEQRVTMGTDAGKVILWLALLLQIDGERGMGVLQQRLAQSTNPEEDVIRLCAILGRKRIEGGPVMPNPDYMRPAVLRRFIPVVFEHVKFSEDINRAGGGPYTPTPRDDAQQFRGALLDSFAQIEGAEGAAVLREMAVDPSLSSVRDWILNILNKRLEKDGDLEPWEPADLRVFAREHEVDPKNDKELFSIANKRLLELKKDVEEAENSLRDEVHPTYTESYLRRWLARKLNERSRGRYTVPQEEEIDQRERPDIRVENPKTDPVSIEVKWADNWTLRDLIDGLETQLVCKYLRAYNSRHGLYILGAIGRKQHWEDPTMGNWLTFSQVVEIVTQQAETLMSSNPAISGLSVVGIDFRQPHSGG